MNQQKGVGNTLLNKSIDYATKAGVQVLFGGASENTAALYREGGWQIRSLPLKPGMDTEIKPILIYKFIST
jgi:hypothetical protein